jgi:hypothetical protein
MVVPTCNPSYSGDRGRRLLSLRPTWTTLVRPSLKNKIPTKELETWLKWQSTCLANAWPSVQPPVLQNNNNTPEAHFSKFKRVF